VLINKFSVLHKIRFPQDICVETIKKKEREKEKETEKERPRGNEKKKEKRGRKKGKKEEIYVSA